MDKEDIYNIKKKKTLPFVTTRVYLEGTTLSEKVRNEKASAVW